MQFTLQLSLPHEASSVPVARAMTRRALQALGASDACIDDVELAVSEACTNVVDHAGGTPYSVVVSLEQESCRIEIIDHGAGMSDGATPATAPADSESDLPGERGRGITLMRALVDHLDFEVRAGQGTTVRMEKSLRFARWSAAART